MKIKLQPKSKLVGIEILNFRSIGGAQVALFPMQKCNILIGRNNVGKSNVIRAIERIASTLADPKWILKFDPIDRYNRSGHNEFSFVLHFELDESEQELIGILQSKKFYFVFSEKNGKNGLEITDNTFVNIKDFNKSYSLLLYFTNERLSQGNDFEQNKKVFLDRSPGMFRKLCENTFPSVVMIPEFRQIQPGEQYSLDGKNLILELARYQNPIIGKDIDKKKFSRIQELVRNLLHLPTANLEVTRDDPTIMIEADNNRLPLSSYGTGVHELIILITAVLSVENSICCIEEPEIHLHPALQREFIEFIVAETSNQYVISTHSPALINANLTMPIDARNQIQVFHLQMKNGSTVGNAINENLASIHALNDLGVKASDILQANCIIWVEGPSDRVYLNHWIELIAPELIEGLHYSIMFYGGKLLSHLYMDRGNQEEKVPNELLEILRINQRAIVVIDSDKDSSHKRINQTKNRIRTECANSQSICWITEGREVENYLPLEVISDVLKTGSDKPINISFSQYDKLEESILSALKKARLKKFDYSKAKMKYAREFVKYFEEKHITPELRKHLDEVVYTIKKWNL